MAEFDNFEGGNPTEEDPAAEFLAREQTELAGLEDDNFGESNTAEQSGGGFDAFEGQGTDSAPQEDGESYNHDNDHDNDDEFAGGLLDGGMDMMGGGGGMDMMGGGDGGLLGGGSDSSGGLLDMGGAPSNDQGTPVTDMLGGGGLDVMGGDTGVSGDGLVDAPPSSEPPSGGLFESEPGPPPAQPVTNGPSDAYAAISQVDTQRAEPEKIKIWREEQKTRLEKKDVEEEEKKGEWQEVARKELEDWYKHHAEQLEKAKENNRAAETAFIKERDESLPGAQWEKICRLCEFNPKNMKSTKDVTRMRSMLLQLKQTPLVR